MLKTYKAVLRGDRIEWIDAPPEGQHPIPVHVTVLEESAALSPSERSRAIADALAKLAGAGPLSRIDDPVAW